MNSVANIILFFSMLGGVNLRRMSLIEHYSSAPEEQRDRGANIAIRWQQDGYEKLVTLDCETLSAAHALVYCHF